MKNFIIKKQAELIQLQNEMENLKQLENGTFNLETLIKEIKALGIKNWDITDGVVEIFLKNENDNSATQSECKRVFVTKEMKDELRQLKLI